MRNNDDVIRYNNVAADVMGERNIPIDGLYSVVVEQGVEKCLIGDGVHLSAYGAAVLGSRVAGAIRRHAPAS